MHLENVIVAVGKGVFHRAALAACVDDLGRKQLVALRCCGFLNGHIGIERKLLKYRFAIAVCGFFCCFLSIILISNLERATLQWSTILISF